MPSQKELRWSQLKVGMLTLGALAALTVIIFILAGSTGGLFTRKLNLLAYFGDANGLKVGAPVTLDGVTIGNVIGIRLIPDHEPDAVEVISRVGSKYLPALHTDSTVAIIQAGVLGDAFVNISSKNAHGPRPENNAILRVLNRPGIPDVINSSEESIQSINGVIKKLDTLMDNLNHGHGTAAMFLNDPALAKKIMGTIDQLQTVTASIASGKGTIGKLVTDDEFYNRANSTIGKLNDIATRLDNGEGTAGKFLKDEALYKNLNAAINNTNELLAGINSGKGSLGKLAKDPALANKLEETLTHLNTLLKGINEGKGTLGQIAQNPVLYDNLSKTLNDTGQLITAIRKDPKTYLTVHVKVF
jgi:phospholipid/cholesterol/gamma-HCH transport system substrate-binding protein